MKKIIDGMKFGLGFFFVTIIGFILIMFYARGNWTATNPGTSDSSLFIDTNGTLTKDKWNALINKVNNIYNTGNTVGIGGTANIVIRGWEYKSNNCGTNTCTVSCSAGKKILGGHCRTSASGRYKMHSNVDASNTQWYCGGEPGEKAIAGVYCAYVN